MTFDGTQYTPDFQNVAYPPASASSHAGQILNVFLPDPLRFSTPDGGFAFVVLPSLGSTYAITVIDTGFLATSAPGGAILESGIAVVSLSVTVQEPTPGPYANSGNASAFHSGYEPLSWAGADPPYETLTRPSPEKDVLDALQHMRTNSATYSIDPGRAGYYGVDATAVIGAWCSLGPEKAHNLVTDAQGAASTRFQAVMLGNPVLDFEAFVTSLSGKHFAAAADSPTYEDRAATLALAIGDVLTGMSPSSYRDDFHNNVLPMFAWSAGVPVETSDFSLPYAGVGESAFDSAWQSIALRGLYPETVWLAATAAVQSAVTGQQFNETIADEAAFAAKAGAFFSTWLGTAFADDSYETFDLLQYAPAPATYHASMVQTPGDAAPWGGAIAPYRNLREFEVPQIGTTASWHRLADLFARTARGILPMGWDHPTLGHVKVVFADPDLVVQHISSQQHSFNVRLREVP